MRANPEIVALYEEVAARIGAELPVRDCDDAESWDWRSFLRERKAALKAL